MESLKYLTTVQQHESAVANQTGPIVSYITQTKEVKYHTTSALEYLTFYTLEDGTFTFYGTEAEYSLDDGTTWTVLTRTKEPSGVTTPIISGGRRILWRGINSIVTNQGIGSGNPITDSDPGAFGSTGRFNVSGNPLSMEFGQNYMAAGNNHNSRLYDQLFKNTGVVSAENLYLVGTTYYQTFSGCSHLTTPPSLKHLTGGSSSGSVTSFPSMFANCTSLVNLPELPPMTSFSYYGPKCNGMFGGCTSIVNVPSNYLPYGKMSDSCYNSMFKDCTSLITAPELPGTTERPYCYRSMFENCTSLTTPPPYINGRSIYQGTTLESDSCRGMFKNCTSLTTSPVIAATDNKNSSSGYNQWNSPMGEMFYGCSSLTRIKVKYKYWRNSWLSHDWVVGVAPTGVIEKSGSVTIPSGTSGVPDGWTTVNSYA